jgi:hypothetical protein
MAKQQKRKRRPQIKINNQARECVLYTVLAELMSNTDADAKKVSIIKLQMFILWYKINFLYLEIHTKHFLEAIFFLGIAENYLILDIAF